MNLLVLFTCHVSKCLEQGLTLAFQLTSLVASDNLDVTSQKNVLLAKH